VFQKKTVKRKLPKAILSAIAFLLLSVSTGCSESNNKQAEKSENIQTQQVDATPLATSLPTSPIAKTRVVATFLPMYWFTKAVAGDAANVDIVIPPGTEVHDYQATPDNVKAIANANVLVKNGLGMEKFLDGTLKSAENAKLVQIDASKGIKTVGEISPIENTASGHDHDHGEKNPHVWLDPVLAQQQVSNIRDGLIATDPANKAIYEANAAAYIKQLEDLNKEFQETLQKTPNCTFITFHDAFPYLAKRYNLKQVAVVEIPEDQLSPKDVQKAIDAVKKYKVKTLFSEPEVDNKLLTSLSKDLNLTLNKLDPLENGSTDSQQYFQAMRSNLQTLSNSCK
jgi:zinc transport system substrate-binding protein